MWTCGFSLFFQCWPVSKAWDLNAPGTCWDSQVQVNISIGASCMFSLDSHSILFVLHGRLQSGVTSIFRCHGLCPGPVPCVSHLAFKDGQAGEARSAHRHESWSIVSFIHPSHCLFSQPMLTTTVRASHYSAGITAIVKTNFITGTARSADFTFSSADLLIFSGSETAVTIMAASIPFLRLIFKEFKSHRTPESRSRRSERSSRDKSPPANKEDDGDLSDWESQLSSGGTRRGKLVIKGGKASVRFEDEV